MKDVKMLRTRGAGLCRVGEMVYWRACTGGECYYIPMHAESTMDPYQAELKSYLVLKYGEDVAEGFLYYGLKREASEFFDTVGGELDRPAVIDDVDAWLDSDQGE